MFDNIAFSYHSYLLKRMFYLQEVLTMSVSSHLKIMNRDEDDLGIGIKLSRDLLSDTSRFLSSQRIVVSLLGLKFVLL